MNRYEPQLSCTVCLSDDAEKRGRSRMRKSFFLCPDLGRSGTRTCLPTAHKRRMSRFQKAIETADHSVYLNSSINTRVNHALATYLAGNSVLGRFSA